MPQNLERAVGNPMAECQARNRALETVDQSQERRMAYSKPHVHKKPFETPENPRDTSRPMLNAIVKIVHSVTLLTADLKRWWTVMPWEKRNSD